MPLYHQLRDHLRSVAGELAPDTLMPSEKELTDALGVSRATARRAVADLLHEGVLVTRQGRGTFVADPPATGAIERPATATGLQAMAGCRVLVAGAQGGIGGACVALLRDQGCAVHGVDRDTVDVTEPGGPERAVASAVDELSGLDAVVHAVGMSGRRFGDGPPSACTDEGWSEVLRVNLESAFRLLRASWPALRRGGGGSFVAVGSVLAEHADRDFMTVAYGVSKAGLRSLVRSAALEGAPDGIRVNLVEPGLVDTPMAARAIGDARIAERLRELQPLGGRAVGAGDVAAAACWLISPAAGRTTGAFIPVDGGWTVR